MRTTWLLLIALLLPTACHGSSTGDRRGLPAGWDRDTVASVNGVTIDRDELRLAVADRGHDGGAAADRDRSALDALVADELAAQRAVQLGLGPAGRPRAELAAAFRRQVGAGTVTEAKARAWYEANRDRIGTELRVRHILVRDAARAAALAAEVGAGTSQAWQDLGWARWNQLPAPWLEVVYGLAPGAVSAVIQGPNRRFWIVQVLERRPAAGRTFDGERDLIVDRLGAERRANALAEVDRALRRQASIVVRYLKGGSS